MYYWWLVLIWSKLNFLTHFQTNDLKLLNSGTMAVPYNGWTELQCSLMPHLMCITLQVHYTLHNGQCTLYPPHSDHCWWFRPLKFQLFWVKNCQATETSHPQPPRKILDFKCRETYCWCRHFDGRTGWPNTTRSTISLLKPFSVSEWIS